MLEGYVEVLFCRLCWKAKLEAYVEVLFCSLCWKAMLEGYVGRLCWKAMLEGLVEVLFCRPISLYFRFKNKKIEFIFQFKYYITIN